MLRPEATLMLVALGLYLYDSVLMLSGNEAVIYRGWGGRWYAAFGSNHWRLGFREPYLPNPLTPHRPIFRLQWSFEGAPASTPACGSFQFPDELRHLTPFVLGTGFSLFVLLPLGLFTRLGSAFALGAIALVYANIAIGLVVLLLKRHQMGLSGKQFTLIAFECLVCAPIALNLIRRLAVKERIKEDFTVAAERLLQPVEWEQSRASCLERVDEQIDYETEGSDRMHALQSSRLRFWREAQS